MLPHHLFALVAPRSPEEGEKYGLLALGALGAVLAGKYLVGLASEDTTSKKKLEVKCDDLIASNHQLELRVSVLEQDLKECERSRTENMADIRRIFEALKLDDKNAGQAQHQG